MDRHIIPSPDAEADLESAKRWYHVQGKNLSFRFSVETQKALRRIAQNPFQFPLILGRVRRALLTRFPYSIFFTLNKDIVFVIAVVHQRRADDVWLGRPRN